MGFSVLLWLNLLQYSDEMKKERERRKFKWNETINPRGWMVFGYYDFDIIRYSYGWMCSVYSQNGYTNRFMVYYFQSKCTFSYFFSLLFLKIGEYLISQDQIFKLLKRQMVMIFEHNEKEMLVLYLYWLIWGRGHCCYLNKINKCGRRENQYKQ